MAQLDQPLRTEGDVREYVEENQDEVIYVDSLPLGELWFGISDEGDFTVLRAAGPLPVTMGAAAPEDAEPHVLGPLGDDTELPDGEVTATPRDDTPFAE